jgi:hypothetical protein
MLGQPVQREVQILLFAEKFFIQTIMSDPSHILFIPFAKQLLKCTVLPSFIDI